MQGFFPGGCVVYGTRCGFFTRQGPMPVKSSNTNVHVTEWGLVGTVEQEYENNGTTPLEAIFTFDLPQCSPTSLRVEIDNKVIHAEVKTKEKAAETYDDAIAQGGKAVLMESTEREIFQLSVGNIPPKGKANVLFTFIGEVEVRRGDGGQEEELHVVIPLIRPQRAEGNQQNFIQPPPGFNPPAANTQIVAPNSDEPKVEINVAIELQQTVMRVDSPTHDISATIHGTRALVQIEKEKPITNPNGQAVDLDSAPLTLRIAVVRGEAEKLRAVVKRLPEGFVPPGVGPSGAQQARATHAVGLVGFPELGGEADPAAYHREVIFIVDRSGSMSGSRIDQARSALQLLLRSLPDGCLFNIIGFGTTVEPLFKNDRSVVYTDQSVQEAEIYIQTMNANLGGTELLPALQLALKGEPIKGYPRQIFLLTDGDLNDKESVMHYVRSSIGSGQLFALGIGGEASRRLLVSLVRFGNGTVEFVQNANEIVETVMRQAERAMCPLISEVEIDWGDLQVGDSTPRTVGPVYSGQGFLVSALLKRPPTQPSIVKLAVKVGAATRVLQLEVLPYALTEEPPLVDAPAREKVLRSMLHLLTVRRIVDQAEAIAGNSSIDASRKAATKAMAEALSLAWGVASVFTSFVGVEEIIDSTSGGGGALRQERVANVGLPTDAPQQQHAHGHGLHFQAYAMQAPAAAMPMGGFGGNVGGWTSASGFGGGGMGGMGGFGNVQSVTANTFGGFGGSANVFGGAPARQQYGAPPPAPPACAAPFFAPPPAPPACASPFFDLAPAGAPPPQPAAPFLPTCGPPSLPFMQPPPPASFALQANAGVIQKLIQHQRANGSFILTPALLSVLNISQATAQQEVKQGPQDWGSEAASVWVTAVVLAWLQTEHEPKRSEWRFVAEKARRWLQGALQRAGGGGTVETAVAEATQWRASH